MTSTRPTCARSNAASRPCARSTGPQALGVNPQITIMALATRLAYHLLGKPAPVEEPEPEKIARPRITRIHQVTA
jgi:hypothetical protein